MEFYRIGSNLRQRPVVPTGEHGATRAMPGHSGNPSHWAGRLAAGADDNLLLEHAAMQHPQSPYAPGALSGRRRRHTSPRRDRRGLPDSAVHRPGLQGASGELGVGRKRGDRVWEPRSGFGMS